MRVRAAAGHPGCPRTVRRVAAQLIAVDGAWVPAAGGEASLYVRRSSSPPSRAWGAPVVQYRYLLIASPAGAYFRAASKGVSVVVHRVRARQPGGTGAAKFGGNYAASLLAQAGAAEHGCDQVVWLDAIERRYIEEMGGMNLFFVFGSGGSARLVTPNSAVRCCRHHPRLVVAAGRRRRLRRRGAQDRRRRAAQGVAAGEITEVFACGTAAVITPVATSSTARGVHHRRW